MATKIRASNLHTDVKTMVTTMVGENALDSAQANLLIDAKFTANNTDNLSEGSSNLYFTNARADARADTRAQLKIDALVGSAPGTLDTLQELGDALGDDPNFATTVTNSIATKLPLAGGTLTGDVLFNDGVELQFGTDNDANIEFDPNTFRITANANIQYQGNNHYFRNAGGSVNGMIVDPAGAITMKHNNSVKLVTTSTGIDVTGNATFADDGKAIFGAGSDLQIYHQNSNGNSIIKETGGGILSLQTNGPEASFYDITNDALMARFINGGKVQLNYNGNNKIETTSTGVDVTGTVTADGIFVDTDSIYSVSGTNRVGINKTSPATTLDVGGSIFFSSILRSTTGGSESSPSIQPGLDGDTGMFWPAVNNIGFTTAGTERMRIDASGRLLVGTTNTTLWTATSGGGILARANVSTVIARESTSATQPLLILNETGVDGTLQEFRKDGSIVGSIGVFNSDTVIGTGIAGLRMNDGSPAITPHRMDTNAVADNSIDLGNGSARFKDLYLSNSIKIVSPNTTSAAAIVFGDSADAATGSIGYWNSDDSLRFSGYDNTERMRIDSAGRVGIGHVAPGDSNEGAGLRVHKYVDRAQYYSPAGSYAGSFGYTNNTNNKTWLSVDSGYNQTSSVSAGLFLSPFHSDANGSFAGHTIKSIRDGGALLFSRVNTATSTGTAATESEYMRISGSGNVGIGTSSPNQWASYTDNAATVLQVEDSSQRARIVINGGNGAHLDLVDYAGASNDKHMNIAVDGGILKFGSLNDAGNAFVKNDIMVMDLGSGKVGIGTSNPIGLLSVVDSSTGSGMELQPEITSNTNRLTNYNRTASVYKNFRLDALQLEFQTSGNERMRINSAGRQVYNGSATANGHANFVGEVGTSYKALAFEHTVGGGEVGSIRTTSSTAVYYGDGSNLTGVGGSTTAGAVGTYAFCIRESDLAFGTTYAGSTLKPAGASPYETSASPVDSGSQSGSALSGTWRAMSFHSSESGFSLGLFVRIS